jgi:aromatic ring hydroxylase
VGAGNRPGKWVEKYFTANCDIPAVNRMRILRLIENLTLGTAAVGCLTESMHGKIWDARGKLTFGILYQIKQDSEILGTAMKK